MPTSIELQDRVTQLDFDYASQPKAQVKQCNLSGGEEYTIISTQDRYGFPASACFWHQSGLVTLNPLMTPEAYTEFYKQTYRPLVSAFYGKQIDPQTIQEEQKGYSVELSDFLRSFLAKLPSEQPFSLLDIGGSTGIVSKRFVEDFNCHATILDPAPDELDVAEGLGLKCVAGFLEDSQEKLERNYDLILMCKTIDHLLDVKRSLQIIRDLLAPNGLFYVDMVDFIEVARQAGQLEKAIKIDHPYSFTQPVLEAYLKQIGFNVLAKTYMLNNILVGYVCQKAQPEPNALPDKSDTENLLSEINRLKGSP